MKAQLVPLITECNEIFRVCAKRIRLVNTLSWGAEVAQDFFRRKEAVLPDPVYQIDRDGLAELHTALKSLTAKLQGEHAVIRWLARTQEGFLQAIRLLQEIEEDGFYDASCDLYGSPSTKLFLSQTTNLDLASDLAKRMSHSSFSDIRGALTMSSEEFAEKLGARLSARRPVIPVRVELTDEVTSRAVAGMSRVRIRKGTRFSSFDLISLFNHEIESHCLTAHNGSLQEGCEFMAAGGPRTTMTQEGLAVFFEMYGHSMSQHRFLALCDRVHAVRLAEQGADFIELYRWFKERAYPELEAFFNAQRIFRGARLEGGKPFTKDVVYLAGLLGIYNFLKISVKNQNRLLVESLVCGRIAIEDVPTVTWLRKHGILRSPKFTPWWLDNWEALLCFFSFSSFLHSFDLGSFQSYFDQFSTLQEWDYSV